jgi:hypothetical protein
MEAQLHAFLTSALDGQLHSVGGEKAINAHWIEAWMDSRGGMHNVEKKKVYFPCLELNLDSLIQFLI